VSLPERSSEPVTVLVVDDEDLLRHVVCRGLWAGGYRTLEARSGADALHLLDLASHIQLVITDVIMPDIDGRELGRRIAEKRPALAVLYISAYDLHDIFHRGPPYADTPFLQKPFTPETLLAKVGELLARNAAL
jgi:two-component system, cell cycle sensor histidine kinase and response regulator CckA